MKKAWERIKRGVAWLRKNEETICGSMVLVVGLFVAVLVLMDSDKNERKAPKKEVSGESTTLREDVSSMWHRIGCAVKLCDEEGRCPAWSSKDSRCYMLTKDEKKLLDIYEKTK